MSNAAVLSRSGTVPLRAPRSGAAWACASVALLALLFPLAQLASAALSNSAESIEWISIWLNGTLAGQIAQTAWVCLVAAAVTLAASAPQAAAVSLYRFKGALAVELATLAPMLLAPYAAAGAWAGLDLGRWSHGAVPMAAQIGFSCAPWSYIALRVAISRLPPSLGEAAAASGMGARARLVPGGRRPCWRLVHRCRPVRRRPGVRRLRNRRAQRHADLRRRLPRHVERRAERAGGGGRRPCRGRAGADRRLVRVGSGKASSAAPVGRRRRWCATRARAAVDDDAGRDHIVVGAVLHAGRGRTGMTAMRRLGDRRAVARLGQIARGGGQCAGDLGRGRRGTRGRGLRLRDLPATRGQGRPAGAAPLAALDQPVHPADGARAGLAFSDRRRRLARNADGVGARRQMAASAGPGGQARAVRAPNYGSRAKTSRCERDALRQPGSADSRSGATSS